MTMVILVIIMWAMIGGAISYIVKKKLDAIVVMIWPLAMIITVMMIPAKIGELLYRCAETLAIILSGGSKKGE